MTIIVFLMLFFASFIAVCPAIFRWADCRLCHARLSHHTPSAAMRTMRLNSTRQHTAKSPHLPSDFADANACEYLAATIRSGVSSRDALIMLCESHSVSSDFSHALLNSLATDEPLGIALTQFRLNWTDQPSLLVDCLCSSQIDGVFFPTALDYSVQVLRDHTQEQLSTRAHTAHARATSRILTGLPIISVLTAITVSNSMRDVVLSRGGALLLLLGLLLNVVGWWWIRTIISQLYRTSHISELERLTRSFCVSMMAGLSVIHACEQWSNISRNGHQISSAIRCGESLTVALASLGHLFGPDGETLKRSILEAHHSGAPTHDVVSRFTADLRHTSLFHREERARQLPAKLSMPVVFCVLPAFLFVVLIPIALASLRSLPFT